MRLKAKTPCEAIAMTTHLRMVLVLSGLLLDTKVDRTRVSYPCANSWFYTPNPMML